MKLPISWLKEYVDIGDITPKQLSDKLLSIGFEVEEIISPREDITGVVAVKSLLSKGTKTRTSCGYAKSMSAVKPCR